ncbi:MAG TPA: ABC transporter substrate-binding protein [Vicinamibacterales bacterium]|nr:ABC transporter substrate-binding protein [Vicinamibacterales bacterium]
MSGFRAGTAALVAPLVMLWSCSTARTLEAETASLRVGVVAPVLRGNVSAVDGLNFYKGALTGEALLVIGGDGRPAPRILESWQASPDGQVWRFKVRQGVRFHDGTPVTAGSLAPLMQTELEQSSMGAVQETVAETEDTVRVTLNQPHAFLFEDISFITAQRVVEDTVFFTGPYVVEQESPERLTLKAVSNHYRGKPAIERIEVSTYPDQRNAWSALMRDEIDMLYEVSRGSLDFVRSESSIRVATFTRPYVNLFGFNHTHARLRDPRVRQALNLAVDREALIRSGMAGEGEPATGHVWPRHWAFDTEEPKTVRYDPAEALRLFEAAGLHVRDEPGRMPARLRLKCVVFEPLNQLALVLQRQLAMVDVDLQLEPVPSEDMIPRLGAGEFESFVFSMASARLFRFPYRFWHSSRPMFSHGYSGADDVLDRVRHAGTDEELKAAVSALQRRFHDDPPAVFLTWDRTSRAVSRRFAVPETGDDIYHTIARWKPAAQASNRP